MRKFLATIALVVLPHAALAQGYDGIPEKFFGLIAKGEPAAAVDYVYSTNPWLSRNADQITNLKAELAKLDGLVGKYAFHERLTEEKAGSRYVHLVYLVGYERQPLRFELRLFRPSGEWRFQGMSFDAKLTDDIDKAANRRISGQ